MFDDLLRLLTEAEQAMRAGDRLRAGDRIERARVVLRERMALPSGGPALVPEPRDDLEGLFAFCMHRLVVAHATIEPDAVAGVKRLLEPLRGMWEPVVRERG